MVVYMINVPTVEKQGFQGQRDGDDCDWCLYNYFSCPEGVGSDRNTAMCNRIGGIMVFLYD